MALTSTALAAVARLCAACMFSNVRALILAVNFIASDCHAEGAAGPARLVSEPPETVLICP